MRAQRHRVADWVADYREGIGQRRIVPNVVPGDITARLANEQGREVFAVPGPLGASGHAGPHRLIQQGAKLVTGVADVLEEIAPQLLSRMAAQRQACAAVDLSVVERAVVSALGDESKPVDEVIRSTGTSANEALETLLALELRGVIEQQPGMRFRRKAA